MSYRPPVRSAAVAFSLSLALSGCASSPPGPKASAAAEAGRVPTPYTAEEIRGASPAGRRLDFRVAADGKLSVRVIHFVTVDERGADIESTTMDETGHVVGASERKRAAWSELRDHASFPREGTTVSDATVTVPAGTYPCRVYVVRDGQVTTTFWFAKTLPGPPVKMVVEQGGKVVETRELARHFGT